MKIHPAFARTPRFASLALCIATALAVPTSASAGDARSAQELAGSTFERPRHFGRTTTAANAAVPHASGRAPMSLYVDTCADDDSPGSLRMRVASAMSGDTIYLTQLPMMCSTITLDNNTHTPASIEVNQDSLYLVGPGADQVAIDANYHSSVFRHHGTGTLGIDGLTIKHGKYVSDVQPKGGCIFSHGNVILKNSTITLCAVNGTSGPVTSGGGISVFGDLTVDHSTITKSYATAIGGGLAMGGGAYVIGDLLASYSTISDNEANSGSNSSGGGLLTIGNVTINSSTISGNQAAYAGALSIFVYPPGSAEITNSTISGNTAHYVGGIYTYLASLKLSNSTIAFNQAAATFPGMDFAAGLTSWSGDLTLQSSIVAGNRISGGGAADGASDLGGGSGATLTGANNLITSSTLPDLPGTLHACPNLGPLANNGGPTRTHMLRPMSPALDAGNAASPLHDQRGLARVAGVAADIGAFEWQGEPDERVFVSGFDGLCDQ